MEQLHLEAIQLFIARKDNTMHMEPIVKFTYYRLQLT